ncbi:hypothetical protein LUU34_01059200 [Aix galericulata]|nr:hypothetical protein LUU34_01059200 [Aix galericulata]
MGTWGSSWDPDPAPTPQPLSGHHHVRLSVHPCPSQAAFWHGSSPNSLAWFPPKHFGTVPPRYTPFPGAVRPYPRTPHPLNPFPRDPRAPRCPGAPQLSPPLSAGRPQGPRGQLPEGAGGAPAAGGAEMSRGRGHPTGDSGGTASPRDRSGEGGDGARQGRGLAPHRRRHRHPAPAPWPGENLGGVVPKPPGVKGKGGGTRLNEQPARGRRRRCARGEGDGGAAPRALCVHTQPLGK